MGKVVWTDTWLWHKSGHFQLDTLTEGAGLIRPACDRTGRCDCMRQEPR